MSVDGFGFERGLATPDKNEETTSRGMMNISREIILLVDSSNFGRRSLGVISKVKDVNKIITTKRLLDTEAKKLSQDGIEVIIVKKYNEKIKSILLLSFALIIYENVHYGIKFLSSSTNYVLKKLEYFF